MTQHPCDESHARADFAALTVSPFPGPKTMES